MRRRTILLAITALWAFSCKRSDTPAGQDKKEVGQTLAFSIRPARHGQVLMGIHSQMDTQFILSLGLTGASQVPRGKAAMTECFGALGRIESLMSSHTTTGDVHRLNHSQGEWVKVSSETLHVLQTARSVSEASGGAFDVTWVGLRPLYRIKTPGWKPPVANAIRERLRLVGFKKVVLDPRNTRVRVTPRGVGVDLGGVAKGYSLDVLAKIMKKHGFVNFIINGGGDLVVSGRHPDREWTVAIRDPRERAKHLRVGSIKPGAIVTSGDYERFIMIGKERFSHILDPRTGLPSRGLLSVTVHGPDAAMADALATAVFVLGRDEGMALLERTPGYEGLVVDLDRKIKKTAGFDSVFHGR